MMSALIDWLMLKHPFWFGVLFTICWLLSIVSITTIVTLGAQQRKPPAPVARPESIDLTGTMQRIEAKVDRLGEKFADHEEHTEKLCGPR